MYISREQWKILINYPKRQVGNKMYGGESSHLPLKINTAGVIPAIFASALLLLPITISNFDFINLICFENLFYVYTRTTTLHDVICIRHNFLFYTSIVLT